MGSILRQALLLSLLLVLAGASCGKPPTPASGPTAAQQVLALVNQYRQEHGQGELLFDERLADLIMEHVKDMRRRGKLSHEGFQQRFEQSGRKMCVENVSFNALTPAEVVSDWRNSPGHNANLLNASARYAGVAIEGGYAAYIACD